MRRRHEASAARNGDEAELAAVRDQEASQVGWLDGAEGAELGERRRVGADVEAQQPRLLLVDRLAPGQEQ